MRFQMYIFLGIFLSLYSGFNYYIGSRIRNIIFLSPIKLNLYVYWIIFWVIAFSYVISRFLEKFFIGKLMMLLTKIGIYWMGTIAYLFIFFVFIDFVRVIARLFSLQIDKFVYVGGIASLILTLLLLVYGSWNAGNTKVVNYEVYVNKTSPVKELKAVMVSDIHLGNIVENRSLKKMVKIINDLNPDIVFLAGDIIDSRLKPFQEGEMPDTLKGINSKYGVYAVLGNHEYYHENPDDIARHYEEVGIRVLRDDYVKIEDFLYIVGREDKAVRQLIGKERKELADILKDVDTSLPIILLDHNPKYLNEAAELGIDLQLSGHTHRGQIFPGSLITSRIFEIDWGHLRKGNYNIIVSSGYGTWGPPLRIGTNSEVVNIKIKFSLEVF